MRLTLVALVALWISACTTHKPGPTTILPPVGTGGTGGEAVSLCDIDQDGFVSVSCGGDDCDDSSARVHPQAVEVCDGKVDDDCDGVVDEGCDCTPGDTQVCWPLATPFPAQGACTQGTRTCLDEGHWGVCTGAVTPGDDTSCDGLDQDCDGQDTGCQSCPGGGPEVCGNGLDDDCNGTIDDPSVCVVSCDRVNPRDPGGRDCCLDPAHPAASYACREDPTLPSCDQRPCQKLDDDPTTTCTRYCDAGGCVCGVQEAGIKPVSSAGCGFATPCSLMDCGGEKQLPCYQGPKATLGVGVCHGGLADCEGDPGARALGTCQGQVVPGTEVCGNHLDDDCDGLVDEEEGTGGKACPVARECEPDAVELCGNGIDDDCDGFADEACPAPAMASQACWTGRPLQREVGSCRDGIQVEVEGHWGPCESQVLPRPERCGDQRDDDCNGLGAPDEPEDPGCCVPAPGGEVCNGVDDDCDGLVDEGLRNSCGTCGGSCDATFSVDDPTACDAAGRSCEQIAAAGPGLITLGQAPLPGSNVAVFALTGEPKVDRLDAATDVATWKTPLARGDGDATTTLVLPVIDGSAWSYWLGVDTAILAHLDASTGQELCRFVQPVPAVQDNLPSVRMHPTGRIRFSAPGPDAAETGRRITWELHPSRVKTGTDGSSECAVAWQWESSWNLPVTDDDWPVAAEEWPGSRRFTTRDSNLVQLAADGVGVVQSWPLPDGLTQATQAVRADDGGVWVTLTAGDSTFSVLGFDPIAGSFHAGAALAGQSTEPVLHTVDALRRQAGLIGVWTQDFDTGSYQTHFRTLDFREVVPSGAAVYARIHFADRQEDLPTSLGCGPFTAMPASLVACDPQGGRRWARIDLELIASPGGSRPQVGEIELATFRP